MISPDCKILIDAAVILLSFLNQQASIGRKIVIDFESEDSGVMGYFNRMGFFDHLHKKIKVLPARPLVSGAAIYRGYNKNIVEIAPIIPDVEDEDIASRLADALETKNKALGKATFTIFGELIGNVLEHSSTKLTGFAALQTYKTGIKVVVSDSGDGLLETLRPELPKKYAKTPDIDLLIEAFETGLSRHGKKSGRGCGLAMCAKKAIKFRGNLEVRLATSRVNLVPSGTSYSPEAYCYENLQPIWGTHIAFDFRIDN